MAHPRFRGSALWRNHLPAPTAAQTSPERQPAGRAGARPAPLARTGRGNSTSRRAFRRRVEFHPTAPSLSHRPSPFASATSTNPPSQNATKNTTMFLIDPAQPSSGALMKP